MMDSDLVSLWLTLKLAGATTLVLILLGTPLAWWLSQRSHSNETSWLGNNLPGELWQSATGTTLAFSFYGLVVGSTIYSLPFYVQPLQVAFSALQRELIEAAATLGASPLDRFFSLIVPLCRRGFIIAICLSFAHTVGEFGIVLMIGGNLPDETRVLSIALFDHVEALDYGKAHVLAGGLLGFSFVTLFLLYAVDRHWQNSTRTT